MPDDFEEVLRLVAEGHLTAAEAGPILDALETAERGDPGSDARRDDPADAGARADADPDARPMADRPPATSIRIEITERGRRIINLRVPVSLGRMALDRVPGISGDNADLVRQALAEGRSGTLLHIDEDGSGVRIALE